jgi:hypothetical protein
MRRRQHDRAVGREDVADAQFLGDRPAAICRAVAATMMSQPCAAWPMVSNCVATVPSTSCRRCSGDGGAGGRDWGADGLEAIAWRTAGPMGMTSKPRLAIHSLKSGGTHKRASCPSALSCDASATSGWTSPRDPIVDSNTRMLFNRCRSPRQRDDTKSGLWRRGPPRCRSRPRCVVQSQQEASVLSCGALALEVRRF